MARLPRVTQKIFAGSATNNGVFGAAQAATFTLSNVLATIMGGTAWAQGWLASVIGGSKFPPLEEFQSVEYVHSSQIAYLLQQGISEYDVGTTYFQKNVCLKAGTYQLYGSVTDNNVGNALTDPTNWKLLLDLSAYAGQLFTGGTSTGSANAQAVASATGNFTLVAGNIITWKAGFTNTGAATLAVDGTSATAIKKRGTSGLVDVAAGDIFLNEEFMALYDGTNFELLSSNNPAAFLQKANNLSDLASLSTALTNLGFVTSTGTSGYVKLPGGVIIQWGQTPASGTTTFPIAFPSVCAAIVVVSNANNSTIPSSDGGRTTTNFGWGPGGSTSTADYVAIGY